MTIGALLPDVRGCVIVIPQLGLVMPHHSKQRIPKARARAPEGKRQVLMIMNQEVIKAVKVAAVQDDIKMSHAVEEAVREWLAKREAKKVGK